MLSLSLLWVHRFCAFDTPLRPLVFIKRPRRRRHAEGKYITPMWAVNRVVDLLFFLDMIIIFHLAFQVGRV